MSVARVLRELDELLTQEERALISIDLKTAVSLGERKAELVQRVDDEVAQLGDTFPLDAVELARRVHSKAHKNKFLLDHLRSCLRVVNPTAEATKTYGRDGRTMVRRNAGLVRVRL
jgi:flagellar biosynthesis/type III secretory pathway chaperone